MKIWIIVNRHGNPCFTCDGYAVTGKTRKACIELLCGGDTYFGITLDKVWASWQRDGYDCVRVEVKR